MLAEFLRNHYFMGIVFVLLALGILCQIAIGAAYQRILRETDHMAVTENRLLKQCKLKFTNCYELNGGNVNISAFVDKFMNQFRFAGISLTNLAHMSGQLVLLAVFSAGIGVCRDIINGGTLKDLLPYYIVSFFGLYVYFSVSSLVDAKARREMIRTNLIDYLENHHVKHLHVAEEEEMRPFIRKREAGKEAQRESVPAAEPAEDTQARRGDERKTEELEELLREFLA